MKIPEHIIDEIRTSIDIVDVVGEYVQLKKRGKNYVGLCPFHTEKTPSFTVSPEKQMYHCFGCGKGGNTFTFLMEIDKISFLDAVNLLAEKTGIQIPIEEPSNKKTQTQFDIYYELCRFAAMYFFRNLTETEEGRVALNYLHNRDISDDTIRNFGLGYSMNSWNALLNQAKKEGFKEEDLLKIGLVREREDRSLYDYFRGRVIFPIFSANGKVIGFGARKIREDDPISGKYINSPDSPLYNKSTVLFGLFHAKESIRREDNVLMVEGYVDMISLFQAGFKNAVASSGTALTIEQLALISRYTKNLTLIYDADSAGSNATLRGIDLALENGLNVSIVELPEAEDPDSFIRKHGKDDFNILLKNSVSFIDFKAKQFQRAGAFTTAEGKTDAIRSLVQSIAKIKDELKRNLYIKEISEKYDIYESILYRELEQITKRESRKPYHSTEKKFYGNRNQPETKVQKDESNNLDQIFPEERDIAKLLLEGNPEIIKFMLANFTVGQISNSQLRELVQVVLDIYEEQGIVDVHTIINLIDNEKLKNLISNLVLSRYELSDRWQEMEKEIDVPDSMTIAKDAVIALKKRAVQKEIENNQRALKDATLMHNDSTPYLVKHQELLKLLKEIESLRS